MFTTAKRILMAKLYQADVREEGYILEEHVVGLSPAETANG